MIDFLTLIFLFSLSALFSSSETAFFSLKPMDRAKLSHQKSRRSNLVIKLLKTPKRLLITILLCNLFANLFAASRAEIIMNRWLPNQGMGLFFVISIMTLLILFFGEITPKNFALRHNRKMALAFAEIIRLFSLILRSPVKILFSINEFFFDKITRRWGRKETLMTEEELEKMIEEGGKEGIFDPEEVVMMKGALALDERNVNDILTPWKKVQKIPISLTLPEVIQKLPSLSFSRIPIYQDNPDNPKGILFIKDLIPFLHAPTPPPLADLLRPLHFVPQGMTISSVLDTFLHSRKTNIYAPPHHLESKQNFEREVQITRKITSRKNRGHLFFVMDKRGKVIGIITLQDVLDHVVKGMPPIKRNTNDIKETP